MNKLHIFWALFVFVWSVSIPLEAMEMDENDRKMLESLSPTEKVDFETKLQDAMALYYDNAYQLALPIFRDIAVRVNTLDVLYWYAISAQRTGRWDLAITKFMAMLERHPELNGVRLDLALAYLQKGEMKKAKLELDRVLNAKPSELEVERVDQLMVAFRQKDKRLFATVRLSVGGQYDPNINAQPNDTIPNFSAEQVSDSAISSIAGLDVLYDFGQKKGFVWRNQLSLYNLDHRSSSTFDFFQADFRSGIEHQGKKLRTKLPIGYIDRRFGHKELSKTWYMEPELEYLLREGLNIKLRYRFEKERFDEHEEQGRIGHILSYGHNWILKGQEGDFDLLSVVGEMGLSSSYLGDNPLHTYEDLSLSSSWFRRRVLGLDTLLSGKYLYRNYNSNILVTGLNSPDDRSDNRNSVVGVVSKTFNEKFTASANYNYTNNNSTDDRFSYSKGVLGLNLGFVSHF